MTDKSSPLDMAASVAPWVEKYVQIRDARTALRKKYMDEDEPYKEALGKIEAHLLQVLDSVGATSMTAPAGNFRVTERTTAMCHDWAALWDYIVANNVPQLTQKRLATSEVQAVIEETGAVPPGVSLDTKKTISVTRRRKK